MEVATVEHVVSYGHEFAFASRGARRLRETSRDSRPQNILLAADHAHYHGAYLFIGGYLHGLGEVGVGGQTPVAVGTTPLGVARGREHPGQQPSLHLRSVIGRPERLPGA